jgi:hypothetical protein
MGSRSRGPNTDAEPGPTIARRARDTALFLDEPNTAATPRVRRDAAAHDRGRCPSARPTAADDDGRTTSSAARFNEADLYRKILEVPFVSSHKRGDVHV